MIELTELERDALTELANMGVGRAAANLSRLVAEPVTLSVPQVEIVSRLEAPRLFEGREEGQLVAVGQEFRGALAGRALLIFPEANSLELVRAVAGPDLSLQEVVDMEQEALTEIGNVILNGCLATIANLLQDNLVMTLPSLLRGDSRILFGGLDGEAANPVLFLFIDFSLRQRNVRGYLALTMDLPSLEVLKSLLGGFIRRMTGADAP